MTEKPKSFEKKERVSYSLPPSLIKRIEDAAKEAERPVSGEVKRRLEWSFKKDAK